MNIKPWLYNAVFALCLLPFVTPALALALGIVFSIFHINQDGFKKFTTPLLQLSIVLMGFGMNLNDVMKATGSSFIETAISVTCVMLIGILLGRLLKVENKTTLLIASGTAICGGSAIAAISPIIGSKEHQISFALIVVFILNAVALFIFPAIGHHFHLSQETFGNWAAIAIHDTSSVIGAGSAYGEKALQIATIVKLIRALWIIPLSIVISLSIKTKDKKRIKIPWFILMFALAIVFNHFFPSLQQTYQHLTWLGHRGIVVALFLVGTSFSFKEAKKAGTRSFILGISLWAIIAIGSFLTLKT